MYDVLREMPVTIFIQDNNSEDDVDRVTFFYPEVFLTKNRTNIGFGKAINIGIQQGDAPYVVLLNPDTFLVKGFFETAIEYLNQNPDVGILGPKILDPGGSVQGSARSFPTLLTAFFGRKSLLTRLLPNNRITLQNILTLRSDGTTPMEVDWVSGAGLFVRRKALEDVGLMDERFFMYWEDADLCRRMWESGWKVLYFPKSAMIHHVGVSSRRLVCRSIIEFYKSSYRLFDKYCKPHLRFLKPFIIAGISLKLVFALVINGLWVCMVQQRHTSPTRHIQKTHNHSEG